MATGTWRTWLYELLTYIGPHRLRRARTNHLGRGFIWAADRLLAGGSVEVRGGVGAGLRLSGAHLPVDHQQGFWLVRGTLEPEVQEALGRHIRTGSVVFDVGANLGFFSVLSAALAGPSGRVIALEPARENADAIHANVKVNRAATIEVVDVAAGDHSHFGQLCVPSERAWAHLADRGRHPDTRSDRAVRVVVLDERIAAGALPVPDVIKIDVEGSEASVLRGLALTLAAYDVTVICELHGTGDEVLALMAGMGYGVTNLCAPAGTPIDPAAHVLFQRSTESAVTDLGLPRNKGI